MQPLKNITANIKEYAKSLSEDGFHHIFNHIDQFKIKEGVDRLGLDKFIDQCAYLAAGSGVISGSGGLFTMVIGIPLDFMNLITQQFRVTMAIMYHNRGTYNIDFNEFMSLVAASLKVEASVAITKTMMESVAEKMLMIFGTRTAERLIPVVGAAIGGTTNYLFIRRMAKMVKKMQLEPAVVQVF
ncbi:hypothetical protein [Mucilaginibacter sp.]